MQIGAKFVTGSNASTVNSVLAGRLRGGRLTEGGTNNEAKSVYPQFLRQRPSLPSGGVRTHAGEDRHCLTWQASVRTGRASGFDPAVTPIELALRNAQ